MQKYRSHASKSAVQSDRRSDRIGLVGYHDHAFVIAQPAEAYAAWLQERTRYLYRKVSGSGTNIADGLRVSIELLRRSPRDRLRRLWLLTDGHPTREVDAIMPMVSAAWSAHININTIGFGHDYDEVLLRSIADATHNGKFVSVQTLRALTDALVKSGNGRQGRTRRTYRPETTVLCLDLSGSMLGPMEGRRKVDILEEAILHLLHFKQRCFS